jgi:four helix bundle protein
MQRGYKSLDVWKESVELTVFIYRLTACFPKTEDYGLTSQMRRAAVSVPSNIAEGAGRGATKEFIQFLKIANGSLTELDTQLEIAVKLSYISIMEKDKVDVITESVGTKLAGLIRSLRSRL